MRIKDIKQEVEYMYDDFCDYMRRDTRGVEIAIYGTSTLLFAAAYHKIRPITKFGKASDIPRHFIRDKVIQKGVLKTVQPTENGPLLMINHRPPLFFLVPSRKVLPVKLPGITISANGYSWLQTVAVGRKVEFLPISNESLDKTASCNVNIICPENKKSIIDVSEALVSLGFAKIENIPKEMTDAQLKNYFKYLQKKEKNAKSDRIGVWNSLPPKPWILKATQNRMKSLVNSILPASLRLPALVR